jgi:hypothetical protein
MTVSTPNRRKARKEASTHTRTRFYNLYDDRRPGETVDDVYRRINFTHSTRTAERMLKLRREIGKQADYRPSKHRSGKNRRIISNEQLNTIQNKKKGIRMAPLNAIMRKHRIAATV